MNVITYRSIDQIHFPAFKVYSENWELADGLLFLDGMLVDDTNMPGETLGIRRIQTYFESLLPLRRAVLDHVGLLKQDTPNFIDSVGMPFIYQKTKRAKLHYYKIRRVDRKEVASVLWLHGLKIPFTVPRPPLEGVGYAGVLHLGIAPYLLYEYAEERKKTTWRKV